MPLQAPNLDNRTFEQILAEVRRRIPSFTPEWTDLNDSDPGITLAQLFAFMSEQLLFQVNQVPDKGLITFLKLVGAELHPAAPATADITFSRLATTGPDLIVNIGEGTAVQTAGPLPGSKTPIRFETTRPLPYLRGQLADIVTVDCGTPASHAATDRGANASFAPFGAGRSGEVDFFLVLDLDRLDASPLAPLPLWPSGTFTLRVNVAGSAAVGDPPADAGSPRVLWAYSSGSTPVAGGSVPEFTQIDPVRDSTASLTRSGYLEFRFDAPDVMKRAPANALPSLLAGRFVLRARMRTAGIFGSSPPSLRSIRLNTVPARNVTSVVAERVGASSGRPFQRLRLANAPVLPGSVQLQVRPAGAATDETWTEIADLFAARPGERVFQLIPATGDLLFGDGTFGAILPPHDGSSGDGNVRALYQYGGGRGGNVGAKTLTKAVGVSADATNVLSAREGDDEEPVDSGVIRAPAVIRSRYRAVSAADFEALARETPDVRISRALALPNSRPNLRVGSTPGSVTVILVPHAPFEETAQSPIPLPSHTAASVLAYLDQRRLVTTQVFVRGAQFRRITVDATLRAERGVDLVAARARALDELRRCFHALVGGDDGAGWPFGGEIYFSRVFERLVDLPGIARVDRARFRLDEGDWRECADTPIRPGELLVSGDHLVRVEAPA